ncbi:MAG TPA: hypothetical protein VK638_09455 [Edaphobacter sp.]|nr:hypothetical protein [Edaphobacter sp.]
MTVVMFQLEGNDETLRDAIKVLGHGMEKLSPGAPVYKLIQAPPQSKGNGALPAGADEEEPIDAGVLDTEEGDATGASSQSGSSERTRTRKPPKAIPAVKGIDWDSGTSWKRLCDSEKAGG